MELKEAIEIFKNTYYYPTEMQRTKEAIETVLKILDMPEEEVVFYGGGRSAGKTLKRTYEYGLIVGTKRERVYWEDKIKEKIEEQTKRIDELLDGMIDKSIGCINVSYLSKKEKEEVIAKRNSLVVQKATLQQVKEELLKGEQNK